MTHTYSIIRHFYTGDRETVATGLTECEAMAHCLDPETSSATCTTPEMIKVCKERGAWFDGYTAE